MKKSCFTVAACIALAGSILLTSCSDGFDVSSEIDTVIDLATPSVKAIAYPGMNYVSWTPVSNANGYVVYIYQDGNHTFTKSLGYDELHYKDTDLHHGTKYTYYVEAESKTSTGRAVVTENSACGSASCTAIVPDYNVKSLELNNHEKGLNKKGDEKYVLSESNIHVAIDNFDKFSISFPSKAYLQYGVYFTGDNEFETIGVKDVSRNNIIGSQLCADNAVNNKIYTIGDQPVTKSGVYRIGIVAISENEHFGVSDPVISAETVTIEALPGDVPAITSAAYCNANTVRIVFPKFTLEGGTIAPASYYKVYRSYKDSRYKYTPVTGTVKATDSSSASFYVEDTVTDNTKTLVYTLVVTDGKRFANKCTTKDVNPFALGDQAKTTVSGSATTEETDNTANDITWTIKLPATDVEITGIYTLEVPATDADAHTVVAADFDKTKNLRDQINWTTETDSKTLKAYTVNHNVGTKVYMLVATTQFNKKDAEWISSGVEIKAPEVSATNLKINAYKYDNRLDFSNSTTLETKLDDIVVAVSDTYTVASDSNENYTYELWMADSSVTKDISAGTITYKYGENWTKVKDITLSELKAYDTTKTTAEYTVDYKKNDCPDGVYSFRVIKKSKTTGEFVSSTITTVTIDTSSSIVYKPVISANWDPATATATGTVKVKFEKNNTTNSPVYDVDHDPSKTSPTGYISEAAEEGVKYTLYRATLYNKAGTNQIDPYEVVFTKVNDFTNGQGSNSTNRTVYKWDSGSNSMVPASTTYSYIDYITYTLNDTGNLSTGVTYQYVVVASKAGCKDVISDAVEVTGAN